MAEQSTDEKIAKQIHDGLQHDDRVRSTAIQLRVEGGVVTLSGTVGRYLDRLAAAEDAWRIKGVSEVRNELQVQPDRLRDPEAVAADVAASLAEDDRVNDHSVVVNVAEDVVRLSGTVADEYERRAAEEDAWRTDGVVDVSNELTVSADGRRADPEIEQDVRSALDGDARILDPTQIHVKVVAATVKLEGSVLSGDERQAAENDAWYTAGAVYVENLLTVARGQREQRAA
jgi:osmotically-inducible protein OsmY